MAADLFHVFCSEKQMLSGAPFTVAVLESATALSLSVPYLMLSSHPLFSPLSL